MHSFSECDRALCRENHSVVVCVPRERVVSWAFVGIVDLYLAVVVDNSTHISSSLPVPAMESFHHCIRIIPGITFPRTESLMAAVSTLNALIAKAAGLFERERSRGAQEHKRSLFKQSW